LDLLGEDLFRRKGPKPYVEMTENHGEKAEAEAADEAWNKHLLRNESIIVDLFHGQFKSQLTCAVCKAVSVQFDPFVTVPLPIPDPPKDFSFFYIPYDCEQLKPNLGCSVKVSMTATVYHLRHKISRLLDIPYDSFLLAKVKEGRMISMHSLNASVQEIEDNDGTLVAYEVPGAVRPKLPPPAQCSKSDSNFLIENFVKLVVQVRYPKTSQRPPSYYASHVQYDYFPAPRVVWVHKDWTMAAVHTAIYAYFRAAFMFWYKMTTLKML